MSILVSGASSKTPDVEQVLLTDLSGTEQQSTGKSFSEGHSNLTIKVLLFSIGGTGASEGGWQGGSYPPSFLRFSPIFLEISQKK